jgi:hypothetical protein
MRVFILVLTVLSGLYSCSDETTDDIQLPIFPLNDGNEWIYSSSSNPTPNSMKVTACTVDGVKGFTLQEYVKSMPVSLLNNDSEGNCIESLFNNDKLVHQTVFVKKNVKKGDTWIYKSAVYTNDDYTQYEIEEWEKTCITADTLIVTPKGSFRCVGFKYHPGGTDSEGRPNHTMVHFLSENTGIVKMLHYEHEGGKTWLFDERLLIDYSLNR